MPRKIALGYEPLAALGHSTFQVVLTDKLVIISRGCVAVADILSVRSVRDKTISG